MEIPIGDILVVDVKNNVVWEDFSIRFKQLPAGFQRGCEVIGEYPISNYRVVLASRAMPEYKIDWNDNPLKRMFYICGESLSNDTCLIQLPNQFELFLILRALLQWKPDYSINRLDTQKVIPATEFKMNCSICGATHLITDLTPITNDKIICPECNTHVKKCTHCSRTYFGEYCSYCYQQGACAYCEEQGMYLRRRSAYVNLPLLCDKHANVLVVPMNSYSYKPSPFTYHHV